MPGHSFRLKQVIEARRRGLPTATVIPFQTVPSPAVWTGSDRAVEIRPSVAQRPITPRKRGSQVGFMIDPFRLRHVWFESALERDVATVLIADPTIEDIKEQQVCPYEADRQSHKYTADFFVTWQNGKRTSVEVKYAAQAERIDLKRRLEIIAAGSKNFADEFSVITEKDIDPVILANARLTLSCAKDFDDDAVAIARKCATDVKGSISLRLFGELTGLGVRGERAAVLLIRAGILKTMTHERITSSTVVQRADA